MDGLNRVGVIRRITLPLSLPALASVALYVFELLSNAAKPGSEVGLFVTPG